MKKLRKMLGLAAALVLVFAMGTVVYAATTYSSEVLLTELHQGDILEAGTTVKLQQRAYATVILDGHYEGSDLSSWTVPGKVQVDKADFVMDGSGGLYFYQLEVTTIPEPSASTPAAAQPSGEPQMSAAERWKNSHQNPDNYLPKIVLADGTELRAAFPAHYSAGKGKNVSAVVTMMEDFCRILGIADGNTVHMKGWYSLCGEKMKQLMADYAALLGEQCSAEVTVGEIFELETEIRDQDYNLLGLAKESEVPVEVKIGIEGELRKLSDTMDFAVVMWADGEVTILKDVDDEPWTITVKTTRTSGVFGIIYAPAGSLGL